MRAEVILASRGKRFARRFLIAKNQNATDEALFAEILLATLWPLAYQHINHFVPVHHNKLTSRLGSLVALLFADEDERHLAGTIEQLVMLGAIARLPHGFFLPAPLRWVQLAGRGAWALIGGIPTRLLPHGLSATLVYDQLLRVTDTNPGEQSLLLPVQSFESWIGKPREPLERWTKTLIEQLMERTGAVTQRAIAEAEYEIYMPDLVPSAYQHWRWQAAGELTPSTVRLARTTSRFGYRQWGLLSSDNRGQYGFASLEYGQIDPRRLMYGFDALAKQPTSVTIEPDNQGESVLSLGSELPEAERRFLHAIGNVRSPNQDNYYPRVWTFSSTFEQDVRKMLKSLHIEIKVAT